MSFTQPGWARRGNAFQETPVTMVILMLFVASFLGSIVLGGAVARFLAFSPAPAHILPGLLTYPIVFRGAGDLINLLISGLMFYWFGGSLERSWTSRPFLLFLLAANAAVVMVWILGFFLLRATVGGGDFSLLGNIVIAGPWLMISSVVVAWAWLNPEATILLWFILPIRAKWIAWMDIVLVYFLFPYSQGVGGPLLFVMGFFALGGIYVALLYARYRRDWAWIPRKTRGSSSKPRLKLSGANPFAAFFRPWREMQRRKRIAHLQKTIRLDDDE